MGSSRNQYEDLFGRFSEIEQGDFEAAFGVASDAINALEPLARPEAPHVLADADENEIRCEKCGQRVTLTTWNEPLAAADLVARVNDFIDDHAMCPPKQAIREAIVAYLSEIDHTKVDYLDLAGNLTRVAVAAIKSAE